MNNQCVDTVHRTNKPISVCLKSAVDKQMHQSEVEWFIFAKNGVGCENI